MNLTVLELIQENTILPSGSKEHPLILFPLMFIFCFRLSCNIESQKVMTTIPMDTQSRGMAVRGRTMYYSTWNNGLKMPQPPDDTATLLVSLI
jgi:hypothetical protein